MKKFFAKFSTASQNNLRSDHSFDVDYNFYCSNATTSTTNVKTWNPEFASDPSAWEKDFLSCWEDLKKLILPNINTNNIEVLNKICRLLCCMSNLLIMEINSQPEAIIGPILDHCFNEEIFLHIHNWAINISSVHIPRCQVMLLEIYEDIVNRTQTHNHCLLVHKPILIPMLRLLYWCKRSASERKTPLSEVDKYFVRLLNQICKKIAEDNTTLLEFFFNPPFPLDSDFFQIENEFDKFFLIFNFLIPYMHVAEDVGQLARDALLQIMSVSHNKDFVAEHVLESTFCPVLATGISGFWSELPRSICTTLYITDIDEFHKLNLQTDLDNIPELIEFHKALLFCNAVVQDSHEKVVCHIIHYFYDGFLCTVFKAAVEQLDNEDLISSIVYFHLCLETVTEEPLIQALIKVLIVAETNNRNMNLLELILSKMNENEKLCRVILSLLRTLLNLRCEDLMWNCLIRYILPFIPLKPTRRFDVNVSLNAADRFLSCIPNCTQNIYELNSNQTFQGYLQEAAENIEKTLNRCCKWSFKYDGIKPNSLLNMMTPEELLSSRQPFIRLSSARSSFASNGLNRYFQDRSAHATQDSNALGSDYINTSCSENGLPPLNKLGEDDQQSVRYYEKLDSLFDSGQNEFNDFNSHYDIMSAADNPHMNYFHFTYEGISSESDEANNSRRNSTSLVDENTNQSTETFKNLTLNNGVESDDSTPSSSTSINSTSLTAYFQAVKKIDWKTATSNLDKFYEALDSLPQSKSLTSRTIEENIALIDSRCQYLKEVNAERAKSENLFNNQINISRLNLNDLTKKSNIYNNDSEKHKKNSFSKNRIKNYHINGLLITCTDEKGSGLLLESLFTALEKLVDRSFTTNLQLIGVLNALLSYPQPVITSYLLYVDSIKSNALLRITNILETLKVRIDAYASSTDGFDDMLKRGLRYKITRAERFEKSGWSSRSESCALLSASRRRTKYSGENTRFNANTTFRFTHKAKESQERAIDSLRNRNFAYAAILLSQLCQICAAFALQHNTPSIFSAFCNQGNASNY